MAENSQSKKYWSTALFVLLSGALVLHAFGQVLAWALPETDVRDGLMLYEPIRQLGYLLLPAAVLHAELLLTAHIRHPQAAADDLKAGHRRRFVLRIGFRNFLLGSGLLVMLAVLAAEWVPGLVPFANLIETRYFALFPLAL